MLIVGLTGGIGSGKSTVANYFKEFGITVVDADMVAREVVLPHTPAWQAIVAHFGQRVLMANEEIDRAQLREKIFTDPKERKWLETLLHPLIRHRMQEQLQQATSPYAIAMIPLLFETQSNPMINRTLVVHCTPEQQLHRVQQRSHLPRSQIEAILRSQLSETERLKLADDVIDNTGDLTQLMPQIQQLHQRYLNLAKRKPI